MFRCGFVSKVTLDGKLDPKVPAWATVDTFVCGARRIQRRSRAPSLQPEKLRHLDGVSKWTPRSSSLRRSIASSIGWGLPGEDGLLPVPLRSFEPVISPSSTISCSAL